MEIRVSVRESRGEGFYGTEDGGREREDGGRERE